MAAFEFNRCYAAAAAASAVAAAPGVPGALVALVVFHAVQALLGVALYNDRVDKEETEVKFFNSHQKKSLFLKWTTFGGHWDTIQRPKGLLRLLLQWHAR